MFQRLSGVLSLQPLRNHLVNEPFCSSWPVRFQRSESDLGCRSESDKFGFSHSSGKAEYLKASETEL